MKDNQNDLVADIGGTNSRFALVDVASGTVGEICALRNDDYPSLSDAISAYCRQKAATPRRAALAVAGPISAGPFSLTNRSWQVDRGALIEELGFDDLVIVNDFAAQAVAVTALQHDQKIHLGGPIEGQKGAVCAAIGPGTGLGVGAVAFHNEIPVVLPSEGGHCGLSMVGAYEHSVEAYVLEELNVQRLTGEMLLCGPGLERLHRACLTVDKISQNDQLSAAEISENAKQGDKAALKTVELFVRLLARHASDTALVLGARGGVYITGGVALRLESFLKKPAFRTEFETRDSHKDYISAIPTWLVTEPHAGLIGAMLLLRASSN